jgi:outer membrane protein assembly factor BamB
MNRSRMVGILLLGLFTWTGCASRDWPAYRYRAARTAQQPNASALSDPSRVPSLHQIWEFKPSDVGDPDSGGFAASPTVYRGKVFVGHRNGRFYAVNANTGTLVWRYPAAGQPLLLQDYSGNASSPGIASSGTIAKVWVPWFWFLKRPVKVVLFGAPDPSVCVSGACGSGRLWALDVDTGGLVWKSDVVAHLTGTHWGDLAELHERIGYSSPVVANSKVYVGIADNGDSPIQRGRLVAVDLNTGAGVGAFSFLSSGPPRGGGIWSSPAARDGDLFVTTGNGCRPSNGSCATEPPNNHALSMLKVNGATGAILWKLQPVPWGLDIDPDWAATPVVARTSCGTLAVAPMKDGYTHAVKADTGTVAWSFPFVTGGLPFTYGDHNDWGWTRPAAAWNDVIFAITGGFPITMSGPTRFDGYNRLYALNACVPYTSTDAGRIRWIADIPGLQYTGQPTVTGGIVYVGNQAGTLFAIADPDVAPPVGTRCSNPLPPYASIPACLANGFEAVASPKILAAVPLSGSIRTEPVLARGRVYVATTAGRLHALEP